MFQLAEIAPPGWKKGGARILALGEVLSATAPEACIRHGMAQAQLVTMRVTDGIFGCKRQHELQFSAGVVGSGAEYKAGDESCLVYLYDRADGGYGVLFHQNVAPQDREHVVSALKKFCRCFSSREAPGFDVCIKDAIIEAMQSPCGLVARAATEWLLFNASHAERVLRHVNPGEIQGLLRLGRKLHQAEEARLLLTLAKLGKYDMSAELAGMASVVDGASPSRRLAPDPVNGPANRLPSPVEIELALASLLDGAGSMLKGKVSGEPLYALARSQPPQRRGMAVMLLADLGDDRAGPLLIEQLKAGHIFCHQEFKAFPRYASAVMVTALTEAYQRRRPAFGKAPRRRTLQEDAMARDGEFVLEALEAIGSKEAKAFVARHKADLGRLR